jgi:hypothetical protein
MRTGEEVRVSGATSMAASDTYPRIFFPNASNPPRNREETHSGKSVFKSAELTPGW